jgi:tetratricopeptide (TPR) repeat protein
MKAEHRKELQTNTLAQTLGQAVQGLKEGPSRGTVLVLVLVGLALVLFFTWRYFSTSARETDSGHWLQWDDLTTPAQLDAFLQDKDLDGTEQGLLARFLAARRSLLEGTKDLGFNPGKATDELKKAADLYGKLAEETAKKPVLQEEALMGAGRAHESLGEYDRAKEYYRQLNDKYPNSARGKSAGQQLKRLDDPANAKDLQDLKTEYQPKTPPPAPGAGPP